jgi:hypothetical protein
VTETNYTRLRAINVNEHTEKKNGLTYLSWAWAVDQLLMADPEANWTYPEPKVFVGGTVMVFCTVTAFGKAMTAQLPVMNYKNQAIADPDAFQVNTAMQRCLAKAIALHGLGLYIYAGEDVPPDVGSTPPQDMPKIEHKAVPSEAWDKLDPDEQKYLSEVAAEVIHIAKESVEDAVKYLNNIKLDADEKTALWSRFDSKLRSAMKKVNQPKKEEA